MILYQALSSYQILECMVHRQVFHREETCVLILGTYITERMPGYRELKTEGFFDEVCLFRFGGYRGSDEEIIREVEKEFQKAVPYAPERFDKILAAGIHTCLQVFFAARKIPFEMFEDGSGALSRPWVLAEIHKRSAPGKYELIDRYGLYDHSCPMITKKYCDMKAQEPGFADEKAEDFQVMEQFQRLPERVRGQIRQIFRLPFLGDRRDCVLLLTQQFANLGQLSLEDQIRIYRHLFDYYLRNKKVLIKPHPDDILYYRLLFPGTEIIREPFPSELLPLAFQEMPRTICTVSSTGINQIRGQFRREIVFHARYEKTFRYDPLYEMVLRLARHLGIRSLCADGVNQRQIENLAAAEPETERPFLISGPDEIPDGRYLYLCGDQKREDPGECRPWEKDFPGRKKRKPEGILFLNEEGKYQMYDCAQKSWFLDMVPVRVRVEQLEEDRRFTEHTMYFYTENKEMKKMAESFAAEEEFPHTKTRVSVRQMSDEQIRICMLEGMLKATERRLLEYIDAEKELREELERLRESGRSSL